MAAVCAFSRLDIWSMKGLFQAYICETRKRAQSPAASGFTMPQSCSQQ